MATERERSKTKLSGLLRTSIDSISDGDLEWLRDKFDCDILLRSSVPNWEVLRNRVNKEQRQREETAGSNLKINHPWF